MTQADRELIAKINQECNRLIDEANAIMAKIDEDIKNDTGNV